jgi:hypothetical protein
MLTGKPNKKWAEQLDALDLPAGSSFDKRAAWTKLQQRLDQKQRRKGLIWWTASVAAGVLLLVYLFTNKQDTRSATPIYATILVNPAPASIVVQPIAVLTSVSPVVEKNRKEKIMEAVVVPHNIDTTANSTPLIISYMPVADSVTKTVAVTKRKKMAVVHNNELEPTELIIPMKRANLSTSELLAEYRKHQDLILELTDTLNQTKPRKKLLPFNLISQKQ